MSSTVFVKGFPPEAQVGELERYFESVGRVDSAKIVKNFAFITFQSEEDAQKAVEKFHGRNFDRNDERLVVELTRPKGDRGRWKNNDGGEGSESRRPTGCFLCGKEGHKKFECPEQKRDQRRRSPAEVRKRKDSRIESSRSGKSSSGGSSSREAIKKRKTKTKRKSPSSSSRSKSEDSDPISFSKSSSRSSSPSVEKTKKHKKDAKKKEKENRSKEKKKEKTKSKDNKERKNKKEKKDKKVKKDRDDKKRHEYFSSSGSSSRSKSREKKFSRSREESKKVDIKSSYADKRRSKSPDSREYKKDQRDQRFQNLGRERYQNNQRRENNSYPQRGQERSPSSTFQRKPTYDRFSSKKEECETVTKSRNDRSFSRSISPNRKNSPKVICERKRKNSSCSND